MMCLLDANSARLAARVGGVFYLIIIVLGALGEAVVRGSIVMPGNATAAAANLRSMEWLWRLGVAGEVILLTCATALALILYILLRPVSRDLALLAVFFNLVCIAIEGVAAVRRLCAKSRWARQVRSARLVHEMSDGPFASPLST